MKSGNLKFLEHSGPILACNGTALPMNIADRVSNVKPTVGVSTKVCLYFLFLQNGIMRCGILSYSIQYIYCSINFRFYSVIPFLIFEISNLDYGRKIYLFAFLKLGLMMANYFCPKPVAVFFLNIMLC